jgi:outer membrane protein TolC
MTHTMWTRTQLAAVALCALTASAGAQISLASAVDLAFHADPKVLASQAEIDRARAALSESKDAFVPVISANGGVGKSTGVPLGGPPEIFSMTAQSLVFTWSQRDYIRAAHVGWDSSKLALQQAQDDAAEDVITTYLDLDLAQQRRAAATEALDHAQRLLQIVHDRVSAGQDAPVEIPRTDLTVVELRQSLSRIDTDMATLSDHLGRLTGLKGNAIVALHDSIPALPEAVELAGEESPAATANPGVQAAFLSAQAKADIAHGDKRYLYRPQMSLGANYARITTDFSQYSTYYPGFDPERHPGISYDAFALGISIQLPLLDQGHRAKAKESAAEARKAEYDARSAENMFLEGRLKAGRAAKDLELSVEAASDRAAIAQGDLDAVLLQLKAGAAAAPNAVALTPKDEQRARLGLAQRRLDLLEAQEQLNRAKISLLYENGGLGAWLHAALAASAGR